MGKFKVHVKFCICEAFYQATEKLATLLSIFFLCSLNKIFTNFQESPIDATALKLAIKLDGFFPKDETKGAPIKTCIIHCLLDESFLITPICLKILML